MPDKRGHRGPHPEDHRLFAPDQWPALRTAVADLSLLLSRDYAMDSSLKLVGDHFQLDSRQRLAVMRASCSDQSLALRYAHAVPPEQLRGHVLHLDGYNVLTTIESALGHGIVIRGRDGCLRDMASLHGHYKRVAETQPALQLIGQTLADLAIARADFLLDAPVSNSGRLKTIMLQLAAQNHWPWTVTLVPDPDAILARSPHIIATADSVILDGARNPKGTPPPRLFNLTGLIVQRHVPQAALVDVSSPSA